MRILIVEDDFLIAEHLKEIILESNQDEVFHAASSNEAKEMCLQFCFDLALIDINMDDIESGIEFAKFLNEEIHIPFIFITAQSDKNIIDKAILLKPQAYFVKPFMSVSVLASIQLVRQSFAENYFYFRDGYKECKIPKNIIIYGKSSDNYVELFTEKKKFLIRITLGNLLDQLSSNHFVQVHRSFFVNSNFIESVSSGKLFVNSVEEEIPISKAYEDRIKEIWKN